MYTFVRNDEDKYTARSVEHSSARIMRLILSEITRAYVQLEKRVSVKVKIRSTLSKRLRRRTRSMSLCYRMRAILLTLPARRSDDGDD